MVDEKKMRLSYFCPEQANPIEQTKRGERAKHAQHRLHVLNLGVEAKLSALLDHVNAL